MLKVQMLTSPVESLYLCIVKRILINSVLSICALLTIVSSTVAQVPYRTYVVETLSNPKDPKSRKYEAHWSFRYNDVGLMDSLRYSANGLATELGGLDKMKPFIANLFDWETLPPNVGGFPSANSSNRRCVITEPEPGKIRIFESEVFSSDRSSAPFVVEYDYDTTNLRLLIARGDTFRYVDSAGRISSITRYSSGREQDIWKFYRNQQGVITRIERRRPRIEDSLALRATYQIMKWIPHPPFKSARRDQGLFFHEYHTHFPWLSEGEPASWLARIHLMKNVRGPSLYESKFDSLNRLIRETTREDRKISYDASGIIKRDRILRNKRVVKDVKLKRRSSQNGLAWQDIVQEKNVERYWGEERTHLFTYEYGYRYEDGLWGDRFSTDLVYEVDGDTIKLTIEEPRSLKGLTACVIDTSEKEVAQIPITRRKTTFIFHRRPRTNYAIRWKYEGRKIVDRAF